MTAGDGAKQTMPYGPNPKGTMMVDANGRFSITVVRSDLPRFASDNRMTGTPEENMAIVQGCIAYFGTYSIDEATHVITVNVEGSTFPNFDGGTQDAHSLVQRRRDDVPQSDAVDGRRHRQGDLSARPIASSHCTPILPSRMTLPHLAISALIHSLNCSGVLATGSKPSAARRSRKSAGAITFAMAR